MNVCDMICKAQARKQDRVSSAHGAPVAAHASREQGGQRPPPDANKEVHTLTRTRRFKLQLLVIVLPRVGDGSQVCYSRTVSGWL